MSQVVSTAQRTVHQHFRARESELLRQQGDALRVDGVLVAAEPLLRQALALAQTQQPFDGLAVAAALNSLGLLLKDLARFGEARSLYARAITLVRNAERTPSTLSAIATLYHNLGGIEHASGRYVQGESFARRGMRVRRRIPDADPSSLAQDKVALAALLDAQQQFDQAEALYLEGLSVLESAAHRNAIEIAVALNGLGALYVRRGALRRALPLLERALHVREHAVGPRHPDVAITLNNLAVACRRSGDSARAAALYARAVGIFEVSLGTVHPKTVACRRNQHHLNQEHGRVDQ